MKTIPLSNLLYMLIPLFVTGYFYFRWSKRKFEIAYATFRMILQLLLIGYVLVFLFQLQDYWVGLLVITVMIFTSSLIAIRPFRKKNLRVFSFVLLAVALSGTLMLALVVIAVMDLSPIYQPRLVIPIAGMIYSNSMNTTSLAGERFYTEIAAGKSTTLARSNAYRAALIPQVNSFLAVGLVSLPGMMTGQILAGISPQVAVRYQIMVMAMVLGSAGIAVAIFLQLAKKSEDSKQLCA